MINRLSTILAAAFMSLASTGVAAGELLKSPNFYKTDFLTVGIDFNQEVNSESSGAGEEDCRNFKISASQVRDYLKKAIYVDDAHDYQIGGCRARGRLEFGDGQWGRFVITSSRTGYLFLPGDNAFFLFCRSEHCKDKIYAAFDGVNSDREDADKEQRQRKAAIAKRGQPRSSSTSR